MRQYIYSFCILLVILSIRAEATNYTVKTSGGNYTTISACAAVAKAGDTCTIYAGSYAGWTQSSSGSDDANRITFTANPGDTVNVTSNITINNTSYVTISHLNISGRVNGNSGTNHCVIDHNTMTSAIINITYGETSYDNVVSNNRVTVGGSTIGITMFGDRNRIENNEIFNTNVDCMNVGGTNMVIRNNYCHDVNASSTGEHIDFIQQMGDGVVPVTTYSLIEHNVERNCTNAGGNCHFVILRANKTMTVGADGNIIRFNYAQNIDGAGVVNGGGSNDTAPNTAVYNNTIATNKLWNEIGGIVSCWQGVPTNVIIVNNISYNSSGGGWSPSGCGTSDTTLYENGDIAFTTGFSGSWGSPYSTEATYNTLRNLDPLFANYPTDGTLQSGSPPATQARIWQPPSEQARTALR